MNITIVQAQTSQVQAIKKILSLAWVDTYQHLIPPATIQEANSTWHHTDKLTSEIENPEACFLIAIDANDMIIGLLTAWLQPEHQIFLSRLYIHPQSQRQGIGHQLFNHLLFLYPETQSVDLEVEEANTKGKQFYIKEGFQVISKETVTIENTIIPVLKMNKAIRYQL